MLKRTLLSLALLVASAGADLDDPVGASYDVHVVLNQENCEVGIELHQKVRHLGGFTR